jgi:hypothetical protein
LYGLKFYYAYVQDKPWPGAGLANAPKVSRLPDIVTVEQMQHIVDATRVLKLGLYELMIRNAWATVNTFSQNDKRLRGTAGAVTVLHTHNRRLDFHPHVHLVMPSVAFDAGQRLWRNKNSGFLFDHTKSSAPKYWRASNRRD